MFEKEKGLTASHCYWPDNMLRHIKVTTEIQSICPDYIEHSIKKGHSQNLIRFFICVPLKWDKYSFVIFIAFRHVFFFFFLLSSWIFKIQLLLHSFIDSVSVAWFPGFVHKLALCSRALFFIPSNDLLLDDGTRFVWHLCKLELFFFISLFFAKINHTFNSLCVFFISKTEKYLTVMILPSRNFRVANEICCFCWKHTNDVAQKKNNLRHTEKNSLRIIRNILFPSLKFVA